LVRLISVVDLEGEILGKIKRLQDYLVTSGGAGELGFPEKMHITLNRFDNISNLGILELTRAINGLYFEEFPIKNGKLPGL
jgi:2'-5' RNA ligase